MVKQICALLLCLVMLVGCSSHVVSNDIQSSISQTESVEVTNNDTTFVTESTQVTTEPVVTAPTESTVPVTENTSLPDDTQVEETESVPVYTEPVISEETEPPVIDDIPIETEPEVEKSIDELVNDGIYMLEGSFGFYKGSVSMSEIETVTFTRTAPTSYDESWNANVADTDDIKGYRDGNHVIIVGEHIYANSRCTYMFAARNGYGDSLWSNLTTINGLELLNMSYATNMKMMFAYGQFASLPGIGAWNVSSVTNMSMTFAWCTNLTDLDIADWDVSNVRTFSGMFQGNSHAGDMKLQYLDVSRWNTASAEEMNHMFYGCGLLTYIPVENWDVSGVVTFSHMFADCFSLQSLDLSRWETVSVNSFDAFLNDCRSLVTIDVSGLETTTCQQFSQMFEACTGLQHIIGLETWDVSNASNYAFSETFHCCYSLQELNIGGWTVAPDNTARMVKNCYALVYIDMSGFDMSNNIHVTEMFMGCGNLTEVVGLATWNLTNANGYDSMFIDSGLVKPMENHVSE